MDNVLKKIWKQNCGTKNYKHNHVVYTPLSYGVMEVVASLNKHATLNNGKVVSG
jgi:hypothetical protein